MIKEAKSEWVRKVVYQLESKVVFPLRFKRVEVRPVPILPDRSILLLQNHISWWDGFWGNYLNYRLLHRRYHVMTLEDQMRTNPLLKHLGGFSVRKNSREALASIAYAKNVLQQPQNTVLIFPQGRLQSMNVREIAVEKGVLRLIDQLGNNCQVIYNAVTIEYLESFKPTVKLTLFDCGTADQVATSNLQHLITSFHQQALDSSIRK